MGLIVRIFWESLMYFFKSLHRRYRKKNTLLILSFHGDQRHPEPVKKENIFRWYSFQYISKNIEDESVIGKSWLITIVFDVPVIPCRLKVVCSSKDFPVYEVKDFSTRHAIIYISGEIPPSNVEFIVEQE